MRVPTLFDLAHANGLNTAEINWPCTRGDKTLDDSFPDVPDQVTHMTPRLREELIKLGVLADDTDKSFAANSGVGKDLIWTEATRHIIRARKPNLLVLHLLNCDSTHHAEGAQSPPGYTANAYADMCLARVLAAIDEAGIRDKTTIFVVADHGFTLTPKAIRPTGPRSTSGTASWPSTPPAPSSAPGRFFPGCSSGSGAEWSTWRRRRG